MRPASASPDGCRPIRPEPLLDVVLDDDLELTFIVNEHLIFKRIALPGIKTTMLKEDLFGYTVLCVQMYKQMLVRFIRAFGGLSGTPDEDDDL